jgi:hypothetical protein
LELSARIQLVFSTQTPVTACPLPSSWQPLCSCIANTVPSHRYHHFPAPSEGLPGSQRASKQQYGWSSSAQPTLHSQDLPHCLLTRIDEIPRECLLHPPLRSNWIILSRDRPSPGLARPPRLPAISGDLPGGPNYLCPWRDASRDLLPHETACVLVSRSPSHARL